jgi:citrate lyase alpha subunit
MLRGLGGSHPRRLGPRPFLYANSYRAEYGGFEYGRLPVDYCEFVIILQHSRIRFPTMPISVGK